MREMLLLTLCMVAWAVLPLQAGDSRQADHFELTVPGVPNTVHYFMMKPQGYDPGKVYPMLIVIPGSHDPENEKADDNRGRKGVEFWAYQGTEKFFAISVWYGNGNDAYPHGFKPNATLITDAMIRDVLDRFPIDPNRIFIQAFSQGGLTIKNILHHYRADPPLVLAGILLTDANCRGGNATTACVAPETAVFVGVGSEDKQPNEQFNNVVEAESWVRIFQSKCKDLEHHVIEGQKHNPGPEQFALIRTWFGRVLADISTREIADCAKNLPQARKLLKSGAFGEAVNLTAPACNHEPGDDAAVAACRRIAEGLKAQGEALKAGFEKNRETDAAAAAGSLLTLERLFAGHSLGAWATGRITTLRTDREWNKAFGKAKKQLKEMVEAEKEKAAGLGEE